MSETLPISAILITKNEAHNLPRCLGSLQFCAEIIVVDSGSTDDTVAIAESLGAQVTVTQDWPGFGPQKNRALDRATQPWVLSIDADEWLTPELEDSIRAHVTGRTGPAQILRASSFCGQVMRYSGWGDDWVLRLFPRDTGRFSDDLVHERVVVDGTPSDLSGLLNHETYPDLRSAFQKQERYAAAWAEQRVGQKSASPARAMLSGWTAFVRTYLVKSGWRDGKAGLALALLNGVGTTLKYLYLWNLGRQP